MSRILAVGIAALDLIHKVVDFPQEDAEVRAVSRSRAAGGNATNLLQVMGALGHQCALAGTLAGDAEGEWLRGVLARRGTDISRCVTVQDGTTPVSCITVNARNGSRTIVHYRDLPEFGFTDFAGVSLDAIDWLHFEGRNVAETRRMIDHARERRPDLPVSVEIEKPRPGIESLIHGVDVVFFSRFYARAMGHGSADSLLDSVTAPLVRVCAWGEQGAWARSAEGERLRAPACPPEKVVDSVGAGDAFNAAFLDALLRGRAESDALGDACRLAGAKCGVEGLEGFRPPSPGTG